MKQTEAMYARHRVSRAAIDLLKRFEGYRRTAAQLPDGRWTIGYGHTLTAREGAEVSESDAEALLLYDLISVAHAVNENLYAPVCQNQFDALCSFAFNIGLDNFRRSQVLKRLNAGAMVQAACAMELWRKADFEGERIVVDALVRRRAAEKALFLTPADDAWVPAPSPLLRPMIDLDAQDLVPQRRPVELETVLDGDQIVVRRDAPEADETPDLTPVEDNPLPAVTAAAEAVAGRLETLFADPGEEPAFMLEPLEDPAEPDVEAEPEAELEPQPSATEAEPILQVELPAADDAAADGDLDIPKTPFARVTPSAPAPVVNIEMAPFEFIPARARPAPRRRELSLIWDLLLVLLGFAFFGFAAFWAVYARTAPGVGFVTPLMVAWPAGLAGVGFEVVAVYRLLQRLGRAAERD